jgi:hypothetical protein
MLLAQGMTLAGDRHDEAAEVGMAVEADAEHVPDLPLVPVGGGEDVREGRKRRIVAGEPLAMSFAQKIRHDDHPLDDHDDESKVDSE